MLGRVRERLAVASDLYQDDILILRSLLKLEYSANTTSYDCLQPELSRLLKSDLTNIVTFMKSVSDAPENEVPRNIKDVVLRNVAQDLSEVCIDMRKDETIERQLAAFEKKRDESFAEPCPLEKISAAELGLFTKQFYGSGLYKPIESMLARLRSEIDHAPVMDLHTIYVPFLQELIGLMLMYGIPLTNATYSSFFESVLQNYFQRFVGQEPEQDKPAEHNLWASRALAARGTLESFDHSYFRDILGGRYPIVVLPALVKLQSSKSVSQAHGRFDSLTTAVASGARNSATPVITNEDSIDPALTS